MTRAPWLVLMLLGLPLCAAAETTPEATPGTAQSAAEQRAAAERARLARVRAEAEYELGEAMSSEDPRRTAAILAGAQARGLPLEIIALLKAQLCSALQDAAGEEEQLRSAIYRNPKLAEPYERLGALMERRGLWAEAVSNYQTAITRDPGRPELYIELSAVLLENERYASALAALEAGRLAVPQDAAVAVTLAQTYEVMGEAEAALAEYRRAVTLDQGALRRRALVKSGDLGSAAGQFLVALADYRQAVSEGISVGPELYRRIGLTADKAAAGALDAAWSRAERLAAAGGDTEALRRDAATAVAGALDSARGFLDFLDRLDPPADCRAGHARRRYAHSLVVEALTHVAAYVAAPEGELLATAGDRRAEAIATFAALAAEPPASAGG
jgi:tetratricopeptide (TPR) repeat protein